MKQISLNSIRVILEVYVIKNPTCFSRWSVRITDYKKKARVPIGRIKINYKNNPVIPIATMYCEKENLFYEKQKLFHAVINELNKNLKNIDKKVKILGNAISLNCSSANKS